MQVTFGPGTYIEGQINLSGEIILGEHKLYLKSAQGDLTSTYIPMEKIELLKQTARGIELHVRPTISHRYAAVIEGEKSSLSELVREIVDRRGLKKRFLRKEWVEVSH